MEQVLQQLQEANLQVNMNKSCFANIEIKYLGRMVTTKGIRPLADNVEAIQRLQPPKTLRQLRAFLGMVNYYRDMWRRCSHILAPLTKLTKGAVSSRKAKTTRINWTPQCMELFNKIKQVLTNKTLLAFPDFEKEFEIHTDASKYQLGGVISQEGWPIAFYSRKLNAVQRNYTVGKKEMLSIVELLKEFCGILLEHKINIRTNHKNLAQTTTESQSRSVQQWQ